MSLRIGAVGKVFKIYHNGGAMRSVLLAETIN